MLAEDVTLWSDGGGKVHAALNPIHGPDRVARFFLGVLRKTPPPTLAVRPAKINGQPGIISYVDGSPLNVLTLDVADGRIKAVRIVANPDKLKAVPPLQREEGSG